MNSSDDAIVSKTLDGIIVSWNCAAERMFGWTAAEVIGKSITIIVPEDRLDEKYDVLAQIRRGHSLDHYETIRVRKDGVQIPISLTVSPIRDLSGGIVGASKIARDISDRRRVEEERTRLLAQEQAARLDNERAKPGEGRVPRHLSHELRTPLTSIVGWVRMLRQHALDEAGSVVRAAIDSVRHAATAKSIRLEIAIEPSVRPVAGDAGRLQQVVWNLLSNAVKFTPEGGRVDVRVGTSGSYAEVRVGDNGQGITPGVRAAAVRPDRFTQHDASSTGRHGGLWMGLAIVRHLVELHGRTVSAESPGLGRGATFIVRLPQALARPASDAGRPVTTPPLLNGVRVLAVEDEADTRELIALILRQGECRRRRRGVRRGSARRPRHGDARCCDIAMPGRDGYDLLREAKRRSGPLCRTPFVALTAHVHEGERRRSLAEGFTVHVPKPVDPVELVEVVRNVSRR